MKRLPRLTKTLFLAGASALAMGATTTLAADDPLLSRQWQWGQTDVTDAWDDGYTGSGVVVGVISSWVDFSHPDLEANFSFDFSYDFVGGSVITSSDTDSYTSEGRGTFIAGLIAAASNDVGVTGVAYGALIAGLHVGSDGSYSSSNIYDALIYDDGINYTTGEWDSDDIIRIKDCDFTMSGGAYSGSLSSVTGSLSDLGLDTVISSATRNNVIFVTGSGTSRRSTDGSANSNSSYWTSCEDLIVVASTDKDGVYTSTSSYGSNLFVSAPGSSDVYSTRRESSSSTSPTTDDGDDDGDEDDGDGSLYGTGYSDGASAIVSGAIALAAANNVTMDARWAKWALAYTSTVTDAMRESSDWERNSAGLSFSNDYGFGMINVDDFVEYATNIAYETVSTSFSGTVSRYSSTIAAGSTETITISTATAPNDFTGETTERLTQCVESVELSISISGIDYINDLKITIVSSAGTESVVLDTSKMTEEEIGEIWDGSDLNWTFTSNAFWGTQDTGDWQVVIENNGETTGTINDISLTFNQGSIAMESSNLVIEQGEDASSVDIHGMCIDHSSTTVTIVEGTTLNVEDSIVMNSGTLIVNGEIGTYDSDWKGVKIYLNGGSMVVNENGMVTTSDRGIDIYSGSLTVNTNGWIGGEGTVNIYGGTVNFRGDEEDAAHFVYVEMFGGTLNTSGSVSGTTVTMHGGTFNMSGANNFTATTDGGTVLVQGTASITRLTIGSTETTSGYLYVASGATLSSSGSIAFSGTYVPEEYETIVEVHEEPVLDIYGEPTYDDDGNPIMQEVEEEHKELVHGEYISYAYGDIRGTIDGAVSLDYASVTITGATFTQNLNVNRGSTLFIYGDVSIGTTLSVSGTASETDLDQAIAVAADGSVITAGSVTVGGNGIFYIGGTGIGTTTILGNESTGADGVVFQVTTGGTLEVAVGDMLYTDSSVRLDGATISLSFHDILPTDEIQFIEFTEGALASATVYAEGCEVVFSDMSEVPQVWDGTQGVDLTYEVRDGDGVLDSTCGVPIEPVRLMYPSFTSEQKAVASALRSLLPEGAHAAEDGSKDKALLDAINSLTTLSGLKSAYDQFLPTNLVTINDIHNKQAETITNTIERRAREVRNGAPVSDLWSVPLIGRAGFSFSADPNLIASSGFRQFARYEYDANWMAWANGGYSFSNVDGTKHSDDTKNEMRNASLGIDFAIVEDCSVGIFITYLDGDVEQKHSKSETEADLRGVGAYIAGSRNNDQGSLYWIGMLSYGFVDYDFKRRVHIDDFSSKATSSPDGRQFIGYISLGYEWDAGSHALSYQWTTGPNVSLRYAHNEVDGYKEDSDTSINALKVDDFDYDSLVSSVGWRATVRFDIDEVMTIVPEARVAWQHEFLDSTEKIDVSSFALTGSDGFSTAMNRAGTDYMTVGVGFTVLALEFLTVSFDYDINAFREDSGVEHSFNLMVRARF